MFGWWDKLRVAGRTAAIPEINGHTDLDALWREDAVILFKHSTACPLSWAAHAQVMRFSGREKTVPIYLVHVIKDRETSRRIADRSGVCHASPQVILLRHGVAAESASHGEITQDRLRGMLAQCR